MCPTAMEITIFKIGLFPWEPFLARPGEALYVMRSSINTSKQVAKACADHLLSNPRKQQFCLSREQDVGARAYVHVHMSVSECLCMCDVVVFAFFLLFLSPQ